MTELPYAAIRAIGSLLIVLFILLLPASAPTQPIVVRDIRAGRDPAYVRLVIETDLALPTAPAISINRQSLRITLPSDLRIRPDLLANVRSDDLLGLDTQTAAKATHLVARFSFTPADIKIFTLIDPHRVVVDAYRPLRTTDGKMKDDNQAMQPVDSVEKSPPRPSPDKSAQKGAASRATESLTVRPNGSAPESDRFAAGDPDRSTLHQRLLAILIAVTSILLVVIIYMMCMDRFRQR